MGGAVRSTSSNWRKVATAVFLAATLAGSAFGKVDQWPFAPFSQFSGSVEPDGVVTELSLEGVDETGEALRIGFSELGLRRAEVEEQLNRLDVSPYELLPLLVVAYERHNPSKPRLYELSFRLSSRRLAGGQAVGEAQTETLATWLR